MLARLAPKFVISRVIQTAYYADYMAVELTKQISKDSTHTFFYEDPKKYYECAFYGYISSLNPPTEFSCQYEAEKYQEAVKKLATFNEVKAICERLDEFVIEVRELHRVTEVNTSSANFFGRAKDTDPVFEQDLNDTLTRYHEFLEKLEAYPNWKNKMMEEVGKWFHMIHNNLEEGDVKRNLFSKLNRQEYFV